MLPKASMTRRLIGLPNSVLLARNRAGHPVTTEVRVELEDVGGRTKMVMTHVGVPGDSPGAAGWAIALDKLGAQLEAHSNR